MKTIKGIKLFCEVDEIRIYKRFFIIVDKGVTYQHGETGWVLYDTDGERMAECLNDEDMELEIFLEDSTIKVYCSNKELRIKCSYYQA